MRTVSRLAFILGLFLALAALLPAGAAAQAKPVTLTFWDAEPADLVKLRMEILKGFEAKYPHIKINYLNIPYAEARQKLVTAAATKTLPDTMFFQATWLGEFAAMGELLDLGPYAEKWPGGKNLLPQVFSVGKAYKNTLYYLPSEFQIDALFYRTDWFKEAGIKGPPANWAEFLDAAKKLTDPAKNRYGFSMRGAGGNERYYIMWMLMGNGNVFFEKDGSLGLLKYGGMDGLKWYLELCTVHQACTPNSVNNSFLENTAEFSSGTAAMYIHNQYSVARQIKAFGGTVEAAREKFGTVAIPRGPKGRYIAANFTNGYVIFKQSAHPAETWELVKWMLSPENDSKFSQTTGALPANKSVYDEAWFKNNPFLAVFKEQLDDPAGSFNFPIQMAKWNSLIAGPLKEEFQKGLLKQQSAEATGQAIGKAISDALK